jgi:hypothetical protein
MVATPAASFLACFRVSTIQILVLTSKLDWAWRVVLTSVLDYANVYKQIEPRVNLLGA